MSRSNHTFVYVFVVSICLSMPAVAFNEFDQQQTITTRDLLMTRNIAAMKVSPGGDYVAYQLIQADPESNNYNISWNVISTLPESEPVTINNDLEADLATLAVGITNGEIGSGEVIWSPDGEWIVYTAKRNGEVQLWRSRHDSTEQEQLTYNAADVEGPEFSSDGATLFFAVGRSREAIRELNEIESRQGYLAQWPPVYDVELGPILPPCRDNSERFAREINSARQCQLTIWAFDWELGTERSASPEEAVAYFSESDASIAAQFRRGRLRDQGRNMEAVVPGEQRSAWFENEDPERFQGPQPPMRLATSEGDEAARCELDECRSSVPVDIWWSDDGDEIIFLVRDGYHNTLSSLYGWTPSSDSVRTILSSDDMLYDCAISGRRLICGHESWTTPRRIVSIGLTDGEISTIVDPNPAFQNFRFTRIEKILATDAYGNETHAHLVYPEGYEEGHLYPLVVVQYRSLGFLRGGVGDENPIHVLAQNGFAVLSVDYPDGDYMATEGDVMALNVAAWTLDIVDQGPVTAIERMVDDLADRRIIDPTRVGITGLSTGASTTDLALLRRNYGAASTAYSNMLSSDFRWDPSSIVPQINATIFGGLAYGEESALRASRSIQRNANRVNTPYLIQVADREYYSTNRNYHALRGAEKPVELHIFPDEYHVKWQPAHRLTVYNRNIDWFNFWLRGVEDPDPAKAEQYARWRALRQLHLTNLQEIATED